MWVAIFSSLLAILYFFKTSNFSDYIFKITLFFWLAILILSELNVSDLYSVSDYVYFLFLGFLLFYFFGFFSLKSIKNKYNFLGFYEQARIININLAYHLISFFYLIILSYFLYKYFQVFSYIESAAEVREKRFEVGGMFVNGYSVAIYNYVISSGIWIYKFLLIFSLVFGVIKYKYFFIYGLIACLMYYFIGAGRILVIELALFYFILMSFNKKILGQFSFFKNFIFIFIFLFMFVIGTYIRVSNESLSFGLFYNMVVDSFDQSNIYLTGSFRAFDYSIQNFEFLKYGFGILTFSGFENILFNILNVLGVSKDPYLYTWGRLLSDPILIGNNQSFNALYTGLFNFYFDFGIGGVLFFGYILGVLNKISLNFCFNSEFNIWKLFLVCCFFSASVLIVLSLKFNASLIIVMVLAIFLSYKMKVIKK